MPKVVGLTCSLLTAFSIAIAGSRLPESRWLSELVGCFLHSLYVSLKKSDSFKPIVILNCFSSFGGIQGSLGHLFQKSFLQHDI